MHISHLFVIPGKSVKFKDVFYEWLDYKVQLDGLSKRSFDWNLSDYARFFNPNCRIMTIPFRKIQSGDLECFIRQNIIEKRHGGKNYKGTGCFFSEKLKCDSCTRTFRIHRSCKRETVRTQCKECINRYSG